MEKPGQSIPAQWISKFMDGIGPELKEMGFSVTTMVRGPEGLEFVLPNETQPGEAIGDIFRSAMVFSQAVHDQKLCEICNAGGSHEFIVYRKEQQ